MEKHYIKRTFNFDNLSGMGTAAEDYSQLMEHNLWYRYVKI